MCGRFALYTPPARLARSFGATLADDVAPEGAASWNVAPTDEVLGIRRLRTPAQEAAAGTRVLDHFRWGLVPSWAKDPAVGNRLFNARAESVATKPAFRGAFAARRLIVPCDGFYEWHGEPGRPRQAHFFGRSDGAPLAMAGLFEFWRPPGPRSGDQPWLRTCTVITTTAGPDMSGIHDRMPVVLEPGQLDVWLGEEAGPAELESLLRPPEAGTLTHHRVGPRVGNVRNNDPGLIAEQPAGDGDPARDGGPTDGTTPSLFA